MTVLEKQELQTAIETVDGPCVSIYLPVVDPGRDAQQNAIRWKNSLREAEQKLRDRGLPQAEVETLLKPAKVSIPRNASEFWICQNRCAVFFIAPGLFYYYTLPIEGTERVVVGDCFDLQPLVPLFFERAPFYVLAIAKNSLRLFWSFQGAIREVELPNVARSLDEFQRYSDPEKQLQFHSGGGSNRAPIYHGQGTDAPDETKVLHQWFRQVDDRLRQRLQEGSPPPVVLAGTDALTALYREVSRYPDLLPGAIAGNPESLSPETLRQQGEALMADRAAEERSRAIARFRELAGTGQASADPRAVVPAACHGQVETLFVRSGDRLWGRFDPAANRAILADGEVAEPANGAARNGSAAGSNGTGGNGQHPENSAKQRPEDLSVLATARAFSQGGRVYAVDADLMPADSAIAAVMRYPIPAGQPAAR